ncbi:MAG: hypothetical protein DSZ32_03800 [Gammaproteobacteria bacterium]|nr:MAG: hypothetical protein DSZ32_03800 [Gammaproteobacteria bacterium]
MAHLFCDVLHRTILAFSLLLSKLFSNLQQAINFGNKWMALAQGRARDDREVFQGLARAMEGPGNDAKPHRLFRCGFLFLTGRKAGRALI